MLTWCRFISLAVCMAAITMVFGCGGESDGRSSNVSGSVTYNGAPVAVGTIQFRPASTEGGPAGYADIVDGKYDTTATGKGVAGGSYIVVINGFDGNANPDAELPFGEPLFPEFETKVDIAEGEDVTQDFTVQ
jgi:hypothetical protein